jgi:Domain of unknown function (DUF1707)
VRQVSARSAPLRASAARKEECARELRRHFERGNLDERDFELRMEFLARAVTLGELRRLVADLPVDDRRRLRIPALLRR